MSYIYFPPAFQQDLVVSGTLSMPENGAQQQTYEKALEAYARYQQHSYWYIESVVARVGHNLHVAGRHFMPFAELSHPSDIIEPYAAWSGFNRLIVTGSDGVVWKHNFEDIKDQRNAEKVLRRHLFIWRTRLWPEMHELDRKIIQIAINECINQIDNLRRRQRKRIEPRP